MKTCDARSSHDSDAAGFTRRDLLAVVAVVASLGLLWVPVAGRENDDSDRAVCLSNLRQILAAVSMYSSDNSDFLPHPSWGSLSGSPGPNNWCYATYLADGSQIPNTEGRSEVEPQLPFYEAGQLARYLGNHRALLCPTDWTLATTSGQFANLFRMRQVKLTSYTMSGAVSGYGGTALAAAAYGATHRLTSFAANAFLLWEVDESSPFNFNDVGVNPANSNEGSSRRHTGSYLETLTAAGPGDTVVGRFGGGAEFMSLDNFRASTAELLCGPGYE